MNPPRLLGQLTMVDCLRLTQPGALMLLAGGALAGCGPAAGPPSPPLPAAVVLRVDAVEVSSSRHASQLSWDGADAETDPGAGCKVLVAGATFLAPALAPVSTLCGLASAPHRERHAQDPDLQLRLGVGVDAAYASWIDPDALTHSFRYEFVVPVAALPADGLKLDVLDDDGEVGSELIGSMRISRAKLIEAYQSASKILMLSDGAVRRLEVVLSPYTDAPAVVVQRRASEAPVELGRQVMAGEVVNVRATGSFTVRSLFAATLSPAGYSDGSARSYNLEPFKTAPHACAIALIGSRPTIEGVVVGAGKQFVARHAGPLRVGLNDEDLSNNEGQVSFEVARRAPTAEEWLSGGR
jgi:hypothetical protein